MTLPSQTSSGRGVTGDHVFDRWCAKYEISHRLIPVGVKELNGKVENTHKQDDREFYSKGPYKSFENIRLNIAGYNHRWNTSRRTKALGWLSPEETILAAYVRAAAYLLYLSPQKMEVVEELASPQKIKTRKKLNSVEKYLQYLEWDQKHKSRAIALLPTMSQNFSGASTVCLVLLRAHCLGRALVIAQTSAISPPKVAGPF